MIDLAQSEDPAGALDEFFRGSAISGNGTVFVFRLSSASPLDEESFSGNKDGGVPDANGSRLVEARFSGAGDLASMSAMLDAEESLRASRMRDPDLMRTFIFAHAAVRIFFSIKTGIRPDRLVFCRTALGRPGLQQLSGEYDFNISYRKGCIAFGVSKNRIGVDIEVLPAGVRCADIARRFFSPDECRYIFMSDADVERRFLWVWTRHEALVKYLALGMDSVGRYEVLCDRIQVPGYRACHIHTRAMPEYVLSYACAA